MENKYILIDLETNILKSNLDISKGHSLSRYLESGEMSKFLDAVSDAITSEKIVSLSILILNEKYDVSMVRFDDKIIMINNATDASRTVLEEISSIVNMQVNESRRISKDLASERSALDEMAYLNNRLANMQREIAKKNLELSRLTLTDTLTNAYNRRSFFSDLRQHNEDRTVCMIDIDNFKTINDTYGHTKGDEVLTYFVKEGNLRFADFTEKGLYRLGGDEFALIIRTGDKHKLIMQLELLSSHLNEEYKHISLSYGFTVIPKDYSRSELDSLLSIADKEMYESKNKKKSTL